MDENYIKKLSSLAKLTIKNHEMKNYIKSVNFVFDSWLDKIDQHYEKIKERNNLLIQESYNKAVDTKLLDEIELLSDVRKHKEGKFTSSDKSRYFTLPNIIDK
ncbi:hypothetical protein GUI12_03275 [Anaplasmataceae bacterium AB001_6]|nr:hypothetical protein GUI12_03275 [Anaplasmataceae bacterium AB001_6]